VIVVDSSVWIDAHRRPAGQTAAILTGLLDADEVALALPVRLELLAGIARRDRAALARGLSALPLLRPSDDTWARIERWVPLAADKGHRFGQADWLIAALADEIGALIWSLDEDFTHLEKLKLARLYAVDRNGRPGVRA
jgi:predicted nucleic acid-binding protein